MEHCIVCNKQHDEDEFTHNGTPEHRLNFLLFEWNEYRRALLKNRHGVELTVTIQRRNGYVYDYTDDYQKGRHSLKISPDMMQQHNNTLEFACNIKNVRNNSNIVLAAANILHPYPFYSLTDPNNNLETGRAPELTPGGNYTVTVKFDAQKNVPIGSYKIPVSFTLQTVGKDAVRFTLARSINISIDSENHENQPEQYGPSPFTGNQWPSNVNIFPPMKLFRYFDIYSIPPEYYRYLQYGLKECQWMQAEDFTILAEIRRFLDPGFVTPGNYRMYWHIVLYLEEIGQTLGLQQYNMENVRLTQIPDNLLELEVPGLAEKRPSVIVGDMIDIRAHEDHQGYRGIIHRVEDKTVVIKDVDEDFLDYLKVNPNLEIDVRFILNRLSYERMHQGVDMVVTNGMVPLLFPDANMREQCKRQLKTIRDTEYYNTLVRNNIEQKMAVQKILNASSGSVPYIVFGPPGTGKTVTIVEAILQLKQHTNNRILVCAPANAACDVLTEKLMKHCTKGELLRVVSKTVDKNNMNHSILSYTNYDKHEGEFRRVSHDELKKYRIIVSTLILIGLYSHKYHPDVIFVDEAAQASEPEVNCALGFAESGKQVVLAGDPKQLGPSLSSKISSVYGLGISILERLMSLELYSSGDTNFITMLKLNFRSHPMVLKLPNDLFYEGQLQAVSAEALHDPLAKIFVYKKIDFKGMKGKGKQLVCNGEAVEFCSVLSKESRQGRSPSYFNQKETQMVLAYVRALISLQLPNGGSVRPEEIGVVTPYIRQVYKLRDILRNNNFDGVEVGTTETFQGREKRVIIISTVRAQKDLLLYDKKYNLGFVRHDKRFNVALTRAKSKLIIIGCAHVLSTDKKWLQYIELCESCQTFCGAPFARRTPTVISEITRRFNDVQIQDGYRRLKGN